MMHAFRCPKTGLPEMFDEPGEHDCAACGGRHETYPTGCRILSAGPPAVIGDRLTPHMDWAAGCWINSRSQRRKIYAKKGLRLKSIAEDRRQHGGETLRSSAITFGGQKDCRSTAERGIGEVKTGDGRKVV